MSKFRDTGGPTGGDNEADRERFEAVKKHADADVYLRRRSFRERVRDVAAIVATKPGRDDKWPWQ